MNKNNNRICGNCKHFQDPPFGFPMCRKLKTDTTKQSPPKKKYNNGDDCFEGK